MGGVVPLGYGVYDRQQVENDKEADLVRHIYTRYQALGSVRVLKDELDADGFVSKRRQTGGRILGRTPFSRGALYAILRNPLYLGKVRRKGQVDEGRHVAIVDADLRQAVQEQLDRSEGRKRLRTAAKAPSLLAGLLYDDLGNAMNPSLPPRMEDADVTPGQLCHQPGPSIRQLSGTGPYD